MKNEIARFRLLGWIESISLMVLFFIAMPMKYLMGLPLAVRIVGSIHGGLFLIFIAWLFMLAKTHEWKGKLIAKCVIGSLIPLGPLLYEKDLKKLESID